MKNEKKGHRAPSDTPSENRTVRKIKQPHAAPQKLGTVTTK